MGENGQKWLSIPPQAFSFDLSLLICLSVSLTIFLSQSFFQNLLSKSFFTISLTTFPLQFFLHNLSYTISLSQSFFHNLSFTIFISQSFFHNPFFLHSFFHNLSFTIFLSQSLFQSLQNLGRIVVPSGTCFDFNVYAQKSFTIAISVSFLFRFLFFSYLFLYFSFLFFPFFLSSFFF